MTGPLRPFFTEGQILGAADLNAQVTYDQLGAALHERTEHIWGVAQGLVLTPTPNTTGAKPFVDIDIAPGRAVDQLGRALVVMSKLRLQVSDFQNQIASQLVTNYYPVYIQTQDVAQVGDTQPGKCSVSQTTRFEESVLASFGNPGSELTIADQALPTVDNGIDPTTVPTLDPRVLIGWVQYDPVLKQFIAVNMTGANNATIHYVGVVASDVVAGGGVLTLHTRPDGQPRYVLSITEDSQGGAKLAFGKQDGSTPATPTFWVDEKGDVHYTGTLTPAPVATTLAESGVATDGVTLPLPAGVPDDGSVRVHVVVTPFPQPPTVQVMPSGTPTLAYPFVQTCSVDVNRVVSCTTRWVDLTTPATNFVVLASSCTYLLVASGGA